MMAIGTAIIYAIGVPWLKVSLGMPWETAISEGMTKFLVWDTAKLVAGGRDLPGGLVARRPAARRPLAPGGCPARPRKPGG